MLREIKSFCLLSKVALSFLLTEACNKRCHLKKPHMVLFKLKSRDSHYIHFLGFHDVDDTLAFV